jgi:hypothetical protein
VVTASSSAPAPPTIASTANLISSMGLVCTHAAILRVSSSMHPQHSN